MPTGLRPWVATASTLAGPATVWYDSCANNATWVTTNVATTACASSNWIAMGTDSGTWMIDCTGSGTAVTAYEQHAMQQMLAQQEMLLRQHYALAQAQYAEAQAQAQSGLEAYEALRRRVPTPEEIAAEEARIAAAQAITRAAEEQRARARERARDLLLSHLTPEQRETFEKNGWFIVEGGRTKTRYRIHAQSVAGNIGVLDARDRVVATLCAHCSDSAIPPPDQHLAQKLMLEVAEDDFLRIANRLRC